MPQLQYQGRRIESRPGETVLDACLRQGVNLHFSCRGGSCHSCLSRCVEGAIPARAQRGLSARLTEGGYFLPCVCVPETDMRFERPRIDDMYTRAVLQAREWLSPDVCRLSIEPCTTFDYRPGQFLDIRRDNGSVRSFSIASDPSEDTCLELHVQRIVGGAVSAWLCETLAIGDEVDIRGPNGDFAYAADDPEQSLLFVATGTGLAPVLGVVRDALRCGHHGPIHLYHGTRHAAGLYLHAQLRALEQAHPNLHYHPCLSAPGAARDCAVPGRAHAIAAAAHPDLRGWRVHVAGLPAMVTAAAALFRERGAADADIVVDPFESPDDRHVSDAVAAHVAESPAPPAHEAKQPAPDPELWAALDEGARLMPILEEFYAQVFADPLLSPFFHGSTRQRAIEKVYSFLHQVFTGNKVYFGDRPRNAHHWMTISNQLFDYREDMFFEVVRRHGLPGPLIARWRAMQERYRPEIVKSEPWPKVLNGMAFPLDGFGTMVIDEGSVCDGCAEAIHAGETVRYHLRLGSTFCPRCMQTRTQEPVHRA